MSILRTRWFLPLFMVLAIVALIAMLVLSGLRQQRIVMAHGLATSEAPAQNTAGTPIIPTRTQPSTTTQSSAPSARPAAPASTIQPAVVAPTLPAPRQPAPTNSPITSVQTDLGAAPAGDAQRLIPWRVSASQVADPSIDNAGKQTLYEPSNVVDGQEDTAWRVPGNGLNQYIQLDFEQPVEISSIAILPGYAKTDAASGVNRFWQNYRVKRVYIQFDSGEGSDAPLDDRPDLQSIAIQPVVVASSVRITILETVAPTVTDKRDFTPISEIAVYGRPI